MGLFPLSRPIFGPCLLCIVQHLITLLRYKFLHTYMVFVLLLEICFEWEVIAGLEYFKTSHGLEIDRVGRSCAITMLVAHWFYLGGNVVQVFKGCGNGESGAKRGGNNEEDEDTTVDDMKFDKSPSMNMMFDR